MSITLKVSTKHFRKAISYGSTHQCPLAEALKEKFPNKKIAVGSVTATIGGTSYTLKGWIGRPAMSEYYIGHELGEKLIAKAQSGKRVKTYTVTLNPEKY